MIKTSEDLQTVLEELSADKEISFSGLGRTMNSSDFNTIMYQIETDLNELYEKIRLLNDMAEYTREYVIKQVEEKRAQFVEKLKIIEQLTDSYRDKSYVTHMVPFTVNQTQVRNRAGKIVAPLNINSGKLEMGGTVSSEAKLKTVFLNTSDGCTSATSELLLDGKQSRSSYLMDEPVSGGVTESYTVHFESPTSVNYIDIDTVNCEVKNLKGINASGSTVNIDAAASFMSAKELEGISFDLVSKDYQNAIIANNASNTQSLMIQTGEHRGNAATFNKDESKLSDAEKLNQMGIYRGSYASWVESATSVDNQNTLADSTTVTSYSSSSENRDLDSDAITLADGSVLESFSGTGYQYTPSSEVKSEELVVAGGYVTEDKPSLSQAATEAYKYGYQYLFGIDTIKVQQKAMAEECGYQSDTIKLGAHSYIELSVDKTGDNLVEYYILDGTKEVPILPLEEDRIIKEPLYYQVDTRFAVNYDESVIIYKDDAETSLALSDVDSFDYAAHSYAISYTPANPYRYFPENDKIAVKVIQKKSEVPTTINSISIRKHGGDLYWTTTLA